jgi:hypothetical protein
MGSTLLVFDDGLDRGDLADVPTAPRPRALKTVAIRATHLDLPKCRTPA